MIVSIAIASVVGYIVYAYGTLRDAAVLCGILVAISIIIFLLREDAKKMALKEAGKS